MSLLKSLSSITSSSSSISHLRPSVPFRRSLATMSTSFTPETIYILGGARTPIGSLNGTLKAVSAVELGATAVRAAIERSGVDAAAVEEIYMGQVIQAGVGQSPARQVALAAGLQESADATTINKVCASGMKAITLAAQGMMLGGVGGSQKRSIAVAGGMESMSNGPFLIPRALPAFGGFQSKDSVQIDGLWDAKHDFPMGNCAENTSVQLNITREDQDAHCVESYTRAAAAWSAGKFAEEIAPVTIKGPKGNTVVSEDEEYKKIIHSKVPSLRPVFKKEGGTVTAANASSINDGASAVVLATGEKVKELNLKPLAKIVGFADAAIAPIDFPIAPTVAIPLALKHAGLTIEDISLFEINEAFSVVIKAAEKVLGLDPAKVNINGGGVALGHPIGSSGCRIVVTLIHLLKPGQYGVAAVCNGGGAATAIVVQRL